MSQHLQRRYPGLNYFTTAQKAQFFGRDEEIEELLSLILGEKIVVLFGKSGYGKSSLLRAGILPALDAAISSVFVQLGAYQPGQSLTPVETTLSWLDRTLEDNPESAFLDEPGAADTLWHRFKRKQGPGRQRFLLIFDQFEEFDSYPAEQKNAFKQQLAELLFTRIPQALRDRSDALTDEQQNLLAKAPEIKVVFAIREDRLGVLDGLADKLPAILHKRYRLRGLGDAQAREAVLRPAALPAAGFESPTFAYSPAALDALLQGLKKDEAGADTRIEAFLLQICCEYLEKKVIEQKRAERPAARGQTSTGDAIIKEPDKIVIQPADLPVFNRLFEEYYRGKIAALPDEAVQTAARRMIEDELVKADPATGIAYRINVDGRQLAKLPGMDEALLKRLTDDFLLRSEPNTTGGFSYEVSHDRLVEGILNAKLEYEAEQARLTAEREAREEAARLQAEAEAARQREAEARQREQEAERRRRRATWLAVGAGGAALLAILASGYAWFQTQTVTRQAQKIIETEVRVRKSEQDAAQKQAELETKNREVSDLVLKTRENEEKARLALMAVEKEKNATAEQKRLAAENLREAEKARRQAEAALADVVRLTLKDAESLIYRLDYEAAVEKMKSAAALGALPNAVSDALLEPVFFFAAADNTTRAHALLDTAARLTGRDLAAFGRLETWADFRNAIETLSPGRTAALDARYFPTMINIPGGTDTLGSNEDDDNSISDARPPHAVTLSTFKIASTETTWWQYHLFCRATKRTIPEKPGWGSEGDNPVVNVDWYDAIAYANWLSQHKGLPLAVSGTGDSLAIQLRAGYRLPTEAEWEYAARAGTNFTYSGSDSLDLVGWYDGNSGGRTHPVARKKANAFGLFDMSGNVWEWCWDWYYAYSPNLLTDPTGPASGTHRVLRCGGWGHAAQNCRVACRGTGTPGYRYDLLGFRLASSPQ